MTDNWTALADLDSFLYNKRGPVPGCWLAPLQLPGLRGFWANLLSTSSGHWTNLANLPVSTFLEAYSPAQVSVAISATWPGSIASYFWTTDGDDGVININTATGDTHIASITGSVTFAGWFQLDTISGNGDQTIMSWSEGAQNRCRLFYYASATEFEFWVQDNGLNPFKVEDASVTPAIDTWYYLVARFTPSAEIMIRVNDTQTTNTTSIPAAFRASDYFNVFPHKNTVVQSCPRCAQCWVAAYAVPDHFLDWLYTLQAPLFGLV